MRFIDLFAGLGGFHLALAQLGHECVFASEIDPSLQDLYVQNFGLQPAGDIQNIRAEDIPAHDILCAGFPCQPFSKAGFQQGLSDSKKRGGLIRDIVRIVRFHQPRFVILENVPNFGRHNGGQTWELLENELSNAGYKVDHEHLSPHQFGIPQIRDRIFIVGDRDGLEGFSWPEKSTRPTSIHSVLDEFPPDARKLPGNVIAAIDMWQQFLDRFPPEEKLPSFPIWGMEFGSDYPFEETTPYALATEVLQRHRGALGKSLSGLSRDEIMASLPSYARTQQTRFPTWKRTFIRQNRELYDKHKEWIDEWRPQLKEFAPSFQKFEWNAQGEERSIRQFVLQVRASGLRVKRTKTAPSLVAMTSTQVPIIAWENRYMTPRECSRLQSMGDIDLPTTPTRAYAALGNAVNVCVVEKVAEALLGNRQATASCDCGSSAREAPESYQMTLPERVQLSIR